MQEEPGVKPSSCICKILKLSNGETVIGNITKETASYIDIEMPLRILFRMNQNTASVDIAIAKWDPMFDNDFPIRIYKNSIVACAEPNSMLVKNYTEALNESTTSEVEENSSEAEEDTFLQYQLSKMNTIH